MRENTEKYSRNRRVRIIIAINLFTTIKNLRRLLMRYLIGKPSLIVSSFSTFDFPNRAPCNPALFD